MGNPLECSTRDGWEYPDVFTKGPAVKPGWGGKPWEPALPARSPGCPVLLLCSVCFALGAAPAPPARWLLLAVLSNETRCCCCSLGSWCSGDLH